jgi:hypothetical protein
MFVFRLLCVISLLYEHAVGGNGGRVSAPLTRLVCKNQHPPLLRHQLFRLNQNRRTVRTPEQFKWACEGGAATGQSRLGQLSMNTLRHVYHNRAGGRSRPNTMGSRKLQVFVFDFRLASGEIVVDFKKLSPNHPLPTPPSSTRITINLVVKQFVTFRLINLPSFVDRILLNGDCSVNLIEPSAGSHVQILNSPRYDENDENDEDEGEQKQGGHQGGLATRRKWIDYLERVDNIQIDQYVEYQTLLCLVSHVRIDLRRMLDLANDHDDHDGDDDSLAKNDLVEYLKEISDDEFEVNSDNVTIAEQDDGLVKHCSRVSVVESTTTTTTTKEQSDGGDELLPVNLTSSNATVSRRSDWQNSHWKTFSKVNLNLARPSVNEPTVAASDKNEQETQHQIYIFDVEQFDNSTPYRSNMSNDNDDDETGELSVFIKECNIHKKYILVIYLERFSNKKILLDDFNCQITVYVRECDIFCLYRKSPYGRLARA